MRAAGLGWVVEIGPAGRGAGGAGRPRKGKDEAILFQAGCFHFNGNFLLVIGKTASGRLILG